MLCTSCLIWITCKKFPLSSWTVLMESQNTMLQSLSNSPWGEQHKWSVAFSIADAIHLYSTCHSHISVLSASHRPARSDHRYVQLMHKSWHSDLETSGNEIQGPIKSTLSVHILSVNKKKINNNKCDKTHLNVCALYWTNTNISTHFRKLIQTVLGLCFVFSH